MLEAQLLYMQNVMKELMPKITDWKLIEEKDNSYSFYSEKYKTKYVFKLHNE